MTFKQSGRNFDVPQNVLETIGLYQGILGRLADSAGFEYWRTLIDEGVELEDTINAFIGSPEFSQLYGPLANIGQDLGPTERFVQSLYGNFFGRTSDMDGEIFWTDLLLKKQISVQEVITQFLSSAEFQHASAVAANNWFTNYTTYQERTIEGADRYITAESLSSASDPGVLAEIRGIYGANVEIVSETVKVTLAPSFSFLTSVNYLNVLVQNANWLVGLSGQGSYPPGMVFSDTATVVVEDAMLEYLDGIKTLTFDSSDVVATLGMFAQAAGVSTVFMGERSSLVAIDASTYSAGIEISSEFASRSHITTGLGNDVVRFVNTGQNVIATGAGDDVLATGTNKPWLGGDVVDGGSGFNMLLIETNLNTLIDSTFERFSHINALTYFPDTDISLGELAEAAGIREIRPSLAFPLGSFALDASDYTADLLIATPRDGDATVVVSGRGNDRIELGFAQSTVTGGLGADQIILSINSDSDHVVLTNALTVDSITNFERRFDSLDYDIFEFNAFGAVVAGVSTRLVNGEGVAISQGAASYQNLTNPVALSAANVLNIQNIAFSNTSEVKNALAGGSLALTTDKAINQWSAMVIQWVNSETHNAQQGLVVFDRGVGANHAITVADIQVIEVVAVGAVPVPSQCVQFI